MWFWLSFQRQLRFRFSNCARFGGTTGEVERIGWWCCGWPAYTLSQLGTAAASMPASRSVSQSVVRATCWDRLEILHPNSDLYIPYLLWSLLVGIHFISNIAWTISQIPIMMWCWTLDAKADAEAGWRHRQPKISFVFRLLNIWCCFYSRRPKIWY